MDSCRWPALYGRLHRAWPSEQRGAWLLRCAGAAPWWRDRWRLLGLSELVQPWECCFQEASRMLMSGCASRAPRPPIPSE